MPELPEVETIVRNLGQGFGGVPALPGQRIERATVGWPRHIAEPSVQAFRRRIRGRTICSVRRRGKYLIFPLDRGTMLIHLKMSGDLLMVESTAPPDRYAHTILQFETGWELRFSDMRKFGKVYLLNDPERILGQLGPEPLEDAFTAEVLAVRLKDRKRALKPLLLDQRFIAGMGNIYVDEALHRAQIHPRYRSDRLTPAQIEALWRAIRATLQAGIEHLGASIDWVYRGGDFQNHFRVYGRAGMACPVCTSRIERIIVAQRGTHYCPTCQPEADP